MTEKLSKNKYYRQTPSVWSNGRKEKNFTLQEIETEVHGKKVKALEITFLPGKGNSARVLHLFRPAFNLGEWTDFEFYVRVDSDKLSKGSLRIVESNWKATFSRPFVKSSTVFWGNESLIDRLALKKDVFYFADCDMASVKSRLISGLCNRITFDFNLKDLEKPAKVILADMRFVVKENKYNAEYDKFKNYNKKL